MSLLRAALVCCAALTTGCSGCGGQFAPDDGGASDAAGDGSFVGCPLAECYGVIDLPVGTFAYGEDTCRHFCLEAGAPGCLQAGASCSCTPNPCDGSAGSCACLTPPPEPGPGCVIATCSGSITLPRGTSTIASAKAEDGGWIYRGVAADGCEWDCHLDGSALCVGGILGSCTCGVSICDAGTTD